MAQEAPDVLEGSMPFRVSIESPAESEWAAPLAVAHRGDACHHPENTLAAISAAVAAGVDAIEIDVRFTSDQVPVLHHDRNLLRLLGCSERIDELSFEELRKLEDRVHGSRPELDRRIPALSEVMTRLHGSIELIVEVKSDRSAPGVSDHRERRLRDVLKGATNLTVISFDPWLLRRLRWIDETIPLGINISRTSSFDPIAFSSELGSSLVLLDYQDVVPGVIETFQEQGLRVFIYDGDEAEFDEVVSFRPDGILAYDPFALVREIQERAKGVRAA
jgi:glycerophosphoryl diester phosphodiesterase